MNRTGIAYTVVAKTASTGQQAMSPMDGKNVTFSSEKKALLKRDSKRE